MCRYQRAECGYLSADGASVRLEKAWTSACEGV